MPTLFLAVSSVGAAFTLNVYRPRRRDSVFVVPSFFAAWPTTELAAQVPRRRARRHGRVRVGRCVERMAGLARPRAGGRVVGRPRRDRAPTRAEPESSSTPRSWKVSAPTFTRPLGSVNQDARVGLLSSARFILPVTLRDRRITVSRDVRYAPGAGRRHLLDVYHPTEPVTGAPVLLQIHGGAWIIGNKRQQALPLMHHLAARDWVCVAPNYRLSPRTTFPDHLVDVKLALRWMREHIARYGGDPGFVAITGGSAGGHLAALAALTANDPEYQPGFEGRRHLGRRVRALLRGVRPHRPLRRARRRRHERLRPSASCSRSDGRRRSGRPSRRPRRSTGSHAGAPPFMIVHGTSDSLVPIAGGSGVRGGSARVSRSPDGLSWSSRGPARLRGLPLGSQRRRRPGRAPLPGLCARLLRGFRARVGIVIVARRGPLESSPPALRSSGGQPTENGNFASTGDAPGLRGSC